MKPVTKVMITAAIGLLIIMLIVWYTFYLADFDLPTYIPSTNIKINGVVVFAYLLLVLIISEKKVLKHDPNITILKLGGTGFIIGFSAEIIYQSIRCYVGFLDVTFYFKALLVMGITIAAIAFITAYQLKRTRKPA